MRKVCRHYLKRFNWNTFFSFLKISTNEKSVQGVPKEIHLKHIFLISEDFKNQKSVQALFEEIQLTFFQKWEKCTAPHPYTLFFIRLPVKLQTSDKFQNFLPKLENFLPKSQSFLGTGFPGSPISLSPGNKCNKVRVAPTNIGYFGVLDFDKYCFNIAVFPCFDH